MEFENKGENKLSYVFNNVVVRRKIIVGKCEVF